MSKEIIANTLETLIQQKPYGKITIEEICKATPISRTSFYYHFTSKDDVLIWICKDKFINNCLPYHKISEALIGAKAIFRYIHQDKEFFKAIYDHDAGTTLSKCLTAAHSIAFEVDRVHKYATIETNKKQKVSFSVFQNYAISGTVGVLLGWIASNYKTPIDTMAYSLDKMYTETLVNIRDKFVY